MTTDTVRRALEHERVALLHLINAVPRQATPADFQRLHAASSLLGRLEARERDASAARELSDEYTQLVTSGQTRANAIDHLHRRHGISSTALRAAFPPSSSNVTNLPAVASGETGAQARPVTVRGRGTGRRQHIATKRRS
jgi:hypothetical protein